LWLCDDHEKRENYWSPGNDTRSEKVFDIIGNEYSRNGIFYYNFLLLFIATLWLYMLRFFLFLYLANN
jgi:hypothetical protein